MNPNNVIAIVLAAGAIVLLGAFLFFYNSFSVFPYSTSVPNNSNTAANSVPLQQPEPNDITEINNGGQRENELLWAMIARPTVEKGCLAEAKRSAGNYAWGVKSCSCSQNESEESKFYNCSISAIDGEHPLTISCIKSEGSCLITSEQGQSRLTFRQLQAIVEG